MTYINGPLAALKLGQMIAYDCTISDTALRVYNLIAVHVDKDGECWPSLSKISSKFGVSRQAIAKQIDELALHNYLTKTANFDERSGRRKTNVYRLNLQLANAFQNETDIFSKANIYRLLVYMAMLLKYPPQPLEVTGYETSEGCGGMQLLEVAGDVTPGGCINIPDEHNHVKQSEEEISALATKEQEEDSCFLMRYD